MYEEHGQQEGNDKTTHVHNYVNALCLRWSPAYLQIYDKEKEAFIGACPLEHTREPFSIKSKSLIPQLK